MKLIRVHVDVIASRSGDCMDSAYCASYGTLSNVRTQAKRKYVHCRAKGNHRKYWKLVLLARDSMLSALYAIARPSVRPSVRLSVCHTGGSVKNG